MKNLIKRAIIGYQVNKEVRAVQDEDFEWFKDNYDYLFNTYGDSILVIKNRTVLGSYETYKEALDATLETEQIGTFIIQKCDGTESAYTSQIAFSVF